MKDEMPQKTFTPYKAIGLTREQAKKMSEEFLTTKEELIYWDDIVRELGLTKNKDKQLQKKLFYAYMLGEHCVKERIKKQQKQEINQLGLRQGGRL